MIIVKLKGGLGNQMFQYACGRALSFRYNLKLYLDLEELLEESNEITDRPFELGIFNFEAAYSNKSKIDKFNNSESFLNKVRRKLFNIKYRKVSENSFNYNEITVEKGENLYLDGFWQSEKYFNDIAGIIRKDFVFCQKLTHSNVSLYANIQSSNSVSLHIRRGDYISLKSAFEHHEVCSIDYYKKAITLIKKKIENPFFYIFSDEPVWVKENFEIDDPFTIVAHNQGCQSFQDVRLMAACKHNILANSSFSWWGAWLNTFPEKMVVAPKKWFKSSEINTRDLIPEKWIQI